MIFQHFLLKVDMAIGEVNAHIFGCSQSREVILIDAGKFDSRFADFVQAHDLRLTTVFLTHDHPDHVAGAEECAKVFSAKIVSGVKSPGGYAADRVVAHGDAISVGRLTGRFVETSGHTPVALSLVFPGMVFSGDALFAGSVGGTGAPDAYAKQITQIRANLFSLPGHYEVHSGHGPMTTIGIEREFNPFFV